MRAITLSALCLLVPLGAAAQLETHEKICIPGDDRGNALALAVDRGNTIHISRVFRVGGGGLYHTAIAADGSIEDTEVAERISVLATNEVEQSDLLIFEGQPVVCYRTAREDTFEVALRGEDGGWTREVVANNDTARNGCALAIDDGALVAAWRMDGALNFARRNGPDDWEVFHVDAVDGADLGNEVDLAVLPNGELVAAHRDDVSGQIRVTWRRRNGQWFGLTLDQEFPSGPGPRVVANPNGGAWIVHGVDPGGAGSDAGIRLTAGNPDDGFATDLVDPRETGGSIGAALIDGRLAAVSRELLRSALFGAFDALRYYPDLGNEGDVEVEVFDQADQRHVYRNIDLTADAFGLPVFVALVEAPPFGNLPGSGLTCVWRPADADADRVPDVAEECSSADDPDSDDDGRSDGEELLIDGTDPCGDGPLPDMGAPPAEDAGLPEADEGVPADDAGVEGDAMPEADAGLPADDAAVEADAAAPELDAAPEGDAAPQPEADQGLDDTPDADPDPDAALPSGDASTVQDEGGDDGGCRAAPGSAPLWFALLGLGLARRRR